jgi:glycosyltransferase involved in cell wall biosynthesis
MSPDLVFTVRNGVSIEAFSGAPVGEPSHPYILYAGNRRSYKNLGRLIRAFALSLLPGDGVKLLLTGDSDQRLQSVAADCGIADCLQFSGQVNDEALVQLFRGARLVAFVSLYEGFGLPILEAMAASVPVLTSNISAMPEIAGDAALVVDPSSVDEIARGLERLHYDEELRQRLVRLGRLNALKFNWDATAAATWQIVQRAHK